MIPRSRDRRIIDTTECPVCGAAKGEACRNPTPHDESRGPVDHRLLPPRPHNERRHLWVVRKGILKQT